MLQLPRPWRSVQRKTEHEWHGQHHSCRFIGRLRVRNWVPKRANKYFTQAHLSRFAPNMALLSFFLASSDVTTTHSYGCALKPEGDRITSANTSKTATKTKKAETHPKVSTTPPHYVQRCLCAPSTPSNNPSFDARVIFLVAIRTVCTLTPCSPRASTPCVIWLENHAQMS